MSGALVRFITKHILALPNTHMSGLFRNPSNTTNPTSPSPTRH
jgi:hypothetical protein